MITVIETFVIAIYKLKQILEIVENLIVCLSYFLKTYKKNVDNMTIIIMIIQIGKYLKPKDEDSLKILVIKINLINATKYYQFICST